MEWMGFGPAARPLQAGVVRVVSPGGPCPPLEHQIPEDQYVAVVVDVDVDADGS